MTLNGSFNLVKLYNHVPFLKKANQRFDREPSRSQLQRKKQDKAKQRQEAQRQKQELQKVRKEAEAAGKDPDEAEKQWRSKQNKKAEQQKKHCPRTAVPSRRKWCSCPIPSSR